jgi:O-6-methylguanine DNA methyltransferase|tara:strand:+ start:782 stop:1111 length:330 start_codon:yes stop_codon:yes gene_type:complete
MDSNANILLYSKFKLSVIRTVKKIPKGKVSTYKEVAKEIGNDRAARAVGNVLANNYSHVAIPCHRVVNSDFTLGGYSGESDKRKILEDEGVLFRGNKIKHECIFNFDRS